MQIKFTQEAEADIAFWASSGNKAILAKIYKLVAAVAENPFTGIGKPEPLKGNLSGAWSRRITSEHRFIYEVSETIIYIYSVRGHYK